MNQARDVHALTAEPGLCVCGGAQHAGTGRRTPDPDRLSKPQQLRCTDRLGLAAVALCAVLAQVGILIVRKAYFDQANLYFRRQILTKF